VIAEGYKTSASGLVAERRVPAPSPDHIDPGSTPLGNQIGGGHYKALKIQPIEYIHANNIPFAEGSVIKYVTRWRGKNGLQDLKKARHFIDLLIELEEKAGR
jgi:hypothetical protein